LRKSRGWPEEAGEAIAPAFAEAALSAEGMRAAFSSPASAPALLQRALPGGGAAMVAVEGAATIPGDKGGPTEKEGQGRRYRERVKSRKPPEPEAVKDPARVITIEPFFRSLLRPARLLRAIRADAAKSFTTLLLPRLPTRAGARGRTRAALETGARFNPDILIGGRRWPYIQAV